MPLRLTASRRADSYGRRGSYGRCGCGRRRAGPGLARNPEEADRRPRPSYRVEPPPPAKARPRRPGLPPRLSAAAGLVFSCLLGGGAGFARPASCGLPPPPAGALRRRSHALLLRSSPFRASPGPGRSASRPAACSLALGAVRRSKTLRYAGGPCAAKGPGLWLLRRPGPMAVARHRAGLSGLPGCAALGPKAGAGALGPRPGEEALLALRPGGPRGGPYGPKAPPGPSPSSPPPHREGPV